MLIKVSRSTAIILTIIFFYGCQGNSTDTRPNIIIVMADDMGFSDIEPYGGEIHTPALNSLATNGLRFTQFYNGARCCPTRATLLTGLYAHQTGIGHMVAATPRGPGYLGDLNNQCVTIAQVLGNVGYRNYIVGKWHVSRSLSNSEIHNWPIQRGFDKFYGTITGAGSYYDPATLTYNNEPITAPDDYYYTDAISDSASAFIKQHMTQYSSPFFMYVSYTAPHWPLHALKQDIEKNEGLFDSGWDSLRQERLRKMIDLDIVKKDQILSMRDQNIVPWDSVNNKSLELKKMEVYAAQITSMDKGIGRIVKTLAKMKILDNTLFIFLADNGGCAEEFSQSTAWVRRYGPILTKEKKEIIYGNDNDMIPGPADTYQSYGRNWANLSNTPFRYYKHYVHEGGISTPFIIHWPKKIKNPGSLYSQPTHIIDIMPTVIEAANATYPSEHKKIKLTSIEGVSLIKSFNQADLKDRPLYWEHENNRAIRRGKWKLVTTWDGSWELYDINLDRAEENNLVLEYPDIAQQLAMDWETWAWRTGVLPKPN